jgi:RNA polymerase sigma factor (sigma-70 family)
MRGLTDSQLLREYVDARSEGSFAEVVRRHVDLVYGTALRVVRDAHLAQDVAQGVFMALARSAAGLSGRPVLTGWLYRTTRNLAANMVRSEARRRAREAEGAAMNQLLGNESEQLWERILPHLDEALEALGEAEREALLLRFFQGRTAREIAEALGTSEAAAQKRLARALERMRRFCAKRGVTAGAGVLAAAMATNAAQAAPLGLAGTISAAAMAAGNAVSASASGGAAAVKAMFMTTLQKTLMTAVLVVAAGTGIYQARRAWVLRGRVEGLQRERVALAAQLETMRHERDEARSQTVSPAGELARAEGGQSELARLRAEVTRLRGEKRDLPDARVAWLRQKLEAMPDKSIPELRLLGSAAWANAALATDEGARMAFRQLRDEAVDKFLKLTRAALQKYTAANNGLLPANLLQLKGNFDAPVTDAMLARYELLQAGAPDPNKPLVRKKVMVDDEYDSDQFMSLNGAGGGNVNKAREAVGGAIGEFSRDNFGQAPTEASQVMPYLKRPMDAAVVQKYLNEAEAPPPEAQVIAPALKAYAEAHEGKWPAKPSDLLPYVETPEQKAALTKLEQMVNPPNRGATN